MLKLPSYLFMQALQLILGEVFAGPSYHQSFFITIRRLWDDVEVDMIYHLSNYNINVLCIRFKSGYKPDEQFVRCSRKKKHS